MTSVGGRGMGRRLGYGVAFLVWSLAVQSSVGCGSSGPSGTTGGAGGAGVDASMTSAGGAAGMTTGAGGVGGSADAGTGGISCSDLFAPTLQTYSVDISDTDWNTIQAEFMSAGMLTDQAFFD